VPLVHSGLVIGTVIEALQGPTTKNPMAARDKTATALETFSNPAFRPPSVNRLQTTPTPARATCSSASAECVAARASTDAAASSRKNATERT
jgi:hypothetical protein